MKVNNSEMSICEMKRRSLINTGDISQQTTEKNSERDGTSLDTKLFTSQCIFTYNTRINAFGDNNTYKTGILLWDLTYGRSM